MAAKLATDHTLHHSGYSESLRTQVAREDRLQKRNPFSSLELRFPSFGGLRGIRKEHLQGTELGSYIKCPGIRRAPARDDCS